jgi:hypothetical protein
MDFPARQSAAHVPRRSAARHRVHALCRAAFASGCRHRRNIYKCVERTPAPRKNCFRTPRRRLDTGRVYRGLKNRRSKVCRPLRSLLRRHPNTRRSHVRSVSQMLRCRYMRPRAPSTTGARRASRSGRTPVRIIPLPQRSEMVSPARQARAGAACTEGRFSPRRRRGTRLFRARRSRPTPKSFRLTVVSPTRNFVLRRVPFRNEPAQIRTQMTFVF